ncbi:MFS transporter [Schaalia sp. lx-100]|uniref:MFS transporter n=1 Tax=Schaalia sp. lx-100 TaxID=2899081 RepID=UPI001E36B85E|nr:MFS transporter [Schaalia sp. lx-100]MCD4557040.1 MFS transporter [Schaalia sp. lx-100]
MTPSHNHTPPQFATGIRVWACAMLIYIVAVTARTSLGVSGVEAIERFGLTASGLALFAALQVGVYGCAQIPMGILLDRWGPRRLMTLGAVLVAIAQTEMAFSSSFMWAIIARILLGIGDATAFISVLRLLSSWFSIRHIPIFTQLTSIFGLFGQILSAGPFLMSLHQWGWSPAFCMTAAAALIVAFIAALGIRDSTQNTPSDSQVFPSVSPHVFRNPGTWAGFFAHWIGSGPPMTFTLLWGVPFMTLGMGMKPEQVSRMLIIFSVTNILFGPVMGIVSARMPKRRPHMIALSFTVIAAVWAWLLSSYSPPSVFAATCLVVALALGAVSSSLAFDIVRMTSPIHTLGTALSVANMGGFMATLTTMLTIGITLDALSGDEVLGWSHFRVAMSAQAFLWLIGIIGFVLTLIKARHVFFGRTTD